MKNILTISLLFLAISGYSIEFFHGSFQDAQTKAKQEGKLIFVDAYTSWCGPCKAMSAQVFPTPEVSEVFDASFINIKIDMEKGEGPAFAKKYGVRAYPTLLFLTADGEVVHTKVGGMKPEDLANLGKTVLSKANKAADYSKVYEENPNQSASFMIAYLQELTKANESTAKITNDYLRSNTNLAADSVLMISFYGVEDAGSSLFSSVLANSDKLIALYGEPTVQGKFQSIADKSLNLAKSFHSDQFVLPLNKMDEVFDYEVGKSTIAKFYFSEKNLNGFLEYISLIKTPESKVVWTDRIVSDSPFTNEENAKILAKTADAYIKESGDLEKIGQVLTILHDAGDKKTLKSLKKTILDRNTEESFGIREDQLKAYLDSF